jgi:hypothetical protein
MQTSPAGESPALFSLLYVSDMTEPSAHEVARICERSRTNNLRDGITGVLLFDGRSFCQLVEGPQHAVAALRERLAADPRHLAMRVLRFGPSAGPRRFPSWRLGYAFAADPAAIAALEGTSGDAAIGAFDRLLGERARVALSDA